MNRLPACLAMAALLVTACHRPPPEDPGQKIYRSAVQLFAQASAASQDLTYRDPRFDAVLAALAKVPEGSEFHPDASALASRIRNARESAKAADAESQKAIDQALARPTFQSQGKTVATQGSTVAPRVVPPPARGVPAPSPSADVSQSAAAAAQAVQRSRAAGDQEPLDAPSPAAEDQGSGQEENVPAPQAAPAARAPPPPSSPPPTPPGQVFGLPGPAGRAMGTRP